MTPEEARQYNRGVRDQCMKTIRMLYREKKEHEAGGQRARLGSV